MKRKFLPLIAHYYFQLQLGCHLLRKIPMQMRIVLAQIPLRLTIKMRQM